MVGIAQTLIILTAGIDLSVGAIMVLSSVVMGRLAVVCGVPVPIAFLLGLLTGLACGLINGVLVTRLRLPPFIVTLGTWSIFGALNLWYSQSQTIRQQEVEAAAPFLQFIGHRDQVRLGCRRAVHLRLDPDAAAGGADLVRAQPHRLRPPRLRHRRRSRRGAPRRHRHRPHAARRLWHRRPDLRRRRLGADRPHRRGQLAVGLHRQPRFDHRRGDRRHQPVRRPRLDRRHAGRRPDRRRVPQRPGARPASTWSGRSSPSAC